MKRYVVFAADQLYQGLHGMCEYFITSCATEDDVITEAREASMDIIQSYSDIYSQLQDDIEQTWEGSDYDENEYEEYCDDVFLDDIYFNYWELDESKVQGFEFEELEHMLERDPEEFVEFYCIH